MTRPQLLYPTERRIYHPELATCPHCGSPARLLNYLVSDKWIQTLTGVLSIAVRPSHCPDSACPGFALRLRSVAARHLALPGCTYGLDVVAHLGQLRHQQAQPFRAVQAALAPHIQISLSAVRLLYHDAYLPLLAANERAHKETLMHLAADHGGLFLALDGLAPAGGEPQLWCVSEVLTGTVLRAGWLTQYHQAAFAAFLQPLAATWPIRAVLSDKQQGLEAAISTVFPHAAHQLCQTHYLARLADPVAVADMDLAKTARKGVRQQLGPLLRAEARPATIADGVLTVTGLVPSSPPAAPRDSGTVPGAASSVAAQANEIVSDLVRRVRYLLTLASHPPQRFAGLDLLQGLEEIRRLSHELLAHRPHPTLHALVECAATVVGQVREKRAHVEQAVQWLTDIRTLLDPARSVILSGAGVAADLSAYLERMDREVTGDSGWEPLVAHMWGVSRRYWRGLFHTYDQAGLPRTNNGMESRLREVRRRLIRTNGQAGQTAQQLQRVGAWELISSAATEPEQVSAFATVDVAEWQQERERVREHRRRFRLHNRNGPRTAQQFAQLRQAWLALPGAGTG